MILHTSCTGCRQAITLTAPGRVEPYCDTCPRVPTEQERLESAFLEAVLAGELAEADLLAVTLDRPPGAVLSSLGAPARRLGELGWPVFPLQPGGKAPAIPRERGGKGLKDATTDVERISKYWNKHPTSNIGVATGHRFDVIDVDYKIRGAVGKWADIADTDIEVHALVSTPHGMHAYILPSGLGNTLNMRKHIGIDYRGLGGYVVVPPSRLSGGFDGRYRWWSKPSPMLLK